MDMHALLSDLETEKKRIRLMGGIERLAKQEERGKWHARQRLEHFFDEGAYIEIGMHGTTMGPFGTDKPAADGVICGYGEVNGRMVCAAAYDFSVKGGSIGYIGEIKVARLRELALRSRVPMVWLIDSAGARIDPSAHEDTIAMFAGSGALFHDEVKMSGVIPLVAAMMGPGAAGTAYIPGLADFVPMVKGTSSMALGGPPLVKAATGEEISEEELGGSKVHTRVSGVAHVEVDNDAGCIATIKKYLSFFPSHCEEKPPIIPCTDPIDRRDDTLLTILPENPRAAYDMTTLLRHVVDHGDMLEIQPKFGKSIVTALARIGGYPCGFVASQPKHLGGVLENDSADKAAHFIQVCDAFGIPLVFMVDVPGFMVGSKVEQAGIIRHGAKMLHCMSSATVPKLTVIVRKAYGAGYYVMCGRAFEPDLLVAWPGAEVAVMGAEGMVGIASIKFGGIDNVDPEMKKQMVSMVQSRIDLKKSAGWGYIDDIIDPRDTRRILAQSLKLSWGRTVEHPKRKRGIMPV